ncbi:MAG: zinc ribbon domain-containing protein [Phycisphaerales bacterium]|nr:MAG: zinc ribbon domain-containing protein [Phycisphaerales bacterium]
MPTYDYVCRGCEHAFELFQSMSAPVKRKCPSCGQAKLERLIGTGAAVLFKGGGFYETDYRSASYKKAAEAEQKSSSGSGSGSGSGDARTSEAKPSDSKPAKESKAEKGPTKPKPEGGKPKAASSGGA